MKEIKPILSIILLMTFFFSYSQDYQSVRSAEIAFFESSSYGISCIRIDSVKYESLDSILYPFAVINQVDNDCFSPKAASWIGKHVDILNNGENLFFNRNNDTIIINTLAKPGDIWPAYNIPGSLVIEARVLSNDKVEFLGLSDSVKTIGFQAYDEEMNPLNHGINDMQVAISKNYGFVKTLNFYLFPDLSSGFPVERNIEEYTLAGLSNPKTGVSNFTWFDVYDFQPGDELHIADSVDDLGPESTNTGTYKQMIYRYLQRQDGNDQIEYKYELTQKIRTLANDVSSTTFSIDTITSVITPNTEFDNYLPGEAIVKSSEAYSYRMMSPSVKLEPSTGEKISNYNESCWSMIYTDGCFPVNSYIKGLGGPYYSCTNAFSMGGAERKLVYYKKGSQIWGTPLVITGITDNKPDLLKVYPNPASGMVVFDVNNSQAEYELKVFDMDGRLVKKKILQSGRNEIDISGLTGGIYLYKLKSKSEVLLSGKLLIK